MGQCKKDVTPLLMHWSYVFYPIEIILQESNLHNGISYSGKMTYCGIESGLVVFVLVVWISLDQVMDCGLLGTKPLPEPSWINTNWAIKIKVKPKSGQNTRMFIELSAFKMLSAKIAAILCRHPFVNSLWPDDTIWWHRSKALAWVMVCCLAARSHYLNQCWLPITQVLWHWPEGNFTECAHDIYSWHKFVN